MPDQRITIIENLCKGCGFCIEFCPNKVFEKSDERNTKGVNPPIIVHPDKCTQCGICTMLCPDFALTFTPVEDN